MIKDLENREFIQRLARYDSWLRFLLSIGPESKALLMRILDDQELLFNLKSNDALTFIEKCDAYLQADLRKSIQWQNPLLWKLSCHPDAARIIYNMWDIVDDIDVFADDHANLTQNNMFQYVNCTDAFAVGQISSKTWLMDTVIKLELRLGLTWVLCGWIGVLPYLMLQRQRELGIEKVRSFDLDPACTSLAESLNNRHLVSDWLFKATTIDVNDMSFDGWEYETLKHDRSIQHLYERPDTIINTSCDHMGHNDQWFDSIPDGTLVILQNNDWHDNVQHSSTVSGLNDLIDRYPLENLLYADELDCSIYRRYMIIGFK